MAATATLALLFIFCAAIALRLIWKGVKITASFVFNIAGVFGVFIALAYAVWFFCFK